MMIIQKSRSGTERLSWERECRQFSGMLKIADLNHWAGGLIVACENGKDPIWKIHSFSLDMNSLYHLGTKIGLVTGRRLHTGQPGGTVSAGPEPKMEIR